MRSRRATVNAARPKFTASKTMPTINGGSTFSAALQGSMDRAASALGWLDLSLDQASSSPLAFANVFRCLISEAEAELHALELESDWDSAEDEELDNALLPDATVPRQRCVAQHAIAPKGPSKPVDSQALRLFLDQSRTYITSLKTQLLARLPSTQEVCSEPVVQQESRPLPASPASFDKLFLTLNHVNDLLHSVADAYDAASLSFRNSIPSPTLDSVRSAATTFLAALPEPPHLPLTLSRSFSADAEWFSANQLSLLADTASEFVGHAGEKVREEGQKLKEALVEEKERLGVLIGEEAEKFKKALQEGASKLLRYEDLPHLWQNNEYILSGYRFIPIERWRELLLSAFKWHNETINIYTHVFGAASLCWLLYSLHPLSPQSLSEHTLDRVVSLSFLACALSCLLFSALWHLMSGCATHHLFNSSACLDYVGVSALICSSIFTMIWYGFYCRSDLLRIYASTAFVVGLAGIILPWQAWFNRRKNKNWRIAFFLSMCLSAIVPQCHMAALYGVRETLVFYFPVLMSALAYLVGLIFYGFNFPERLRPGGIFDTLLHSHQFWHVAIVVAIWLQYWALNVMHEKGTQAFSCAAMPPTRLDWPSHVDL